MPCQTALQDDWHEQFKATCTARCTASGTAGTGDEQPLLSHIYMCFSLMLCVEHSVSCSQGQVFQIGQSISTFAVHRAHAAAVPPLQLSPPAQGHSTKAESCCLSAPGCEAVAAAATKLNGIIGAASIGKRPGRERVLNATLVLFRPHLNQRLQVRAASSKEGIPLSAACCPATRDSTSWRYDQQDTHHSRNRNILLAGVCDGEAGPVGSLCQHTVPGDCCNNRRRRKAGKELLRNFEHVHTSISDQPATSLRPGLTRD